MIAGIDVSTRQVAIVLLDDTTAKAMSMTVQLYGLSVWENCQHMQTFMRAQGPRLEVDCYLIGIEDPHGRHNLGTAKKLGMVTGAVLASLPPWIQTLPMPPTEWKRETCGVPMASKPEVAQWVGQTWTNIPAAVDQDTIDAYAIAWAARAVNGRAVESAG